MANGGRSEVHLTLVHGAESVLSPAPLTNRNLLLAGGSIIGILSDAEARAIRDLPLDIQVLDASGCVITPGFVDLHMHITGGGGEAGFSSRAPEAKLSELLNAGITTVVGLTGTDSISRCQEALVAKAKGLSEEGITAYHWCGSYRLPVQTVTGDIQNDVALLDSCVGVGELAVADHRGSNPTAAELARIASDARVGGMLAGKPGLLHLHLGTGGSRGGGAVAGSGAGAAGNGCPQRMPFQTLADAVEGSDVPITQFLPTHCERNHSTRHGAADWLRCGGAIDLTAGDEARAALAFILQGLGGGADGEAERDADVALSRVSVSSDSYGSFPVYDAAGRLLQYRVVKPSALLGCVRDLHAKGSALDPTGVAASSPPPGWPLQRVLRLVTANPAARLGLGRKGRIALGADADLLLFRPQDLELRYVFARGWLVKTPDWVRGSTFEEGPGIRPHVV